MDTSSRLLEIAVPPALSATADGLQVLMMQFAALDIPFETLSNLSSGILIKSPMQLTHTYLEGGGGHCIEHAQLLKALCVEQGFHARLVHADQIDFQGQYKMECGQSYVIVDCAGRTFMCDSFLFKQAYEIASAGGEVQGHALVRKVSTATSSSHQVEVLWFDKTGLRLKKEERLRFGLSESFRQDRFMERYQNFNPFGVLTPFFRVASPEDSGLFYRPAFDDYCVTVEGKSRRLSCSRLADERWIPERFIPLISESTQQIRKSRALYLATLVKGVGNPFLAPLFE